MLQWLLVLCSADPPRKRIDVVSLSHANGTPRLSLGNLAEGSPLAPRRALTVQQMYVYAARQCLLTAFNSLQIQSPVHPITLQHDDSNHRFMDIAEVNLH